MFCAIIPTKETSYSTRSIPAWISWRPFWILSARISWWFLQWGLAGRHQASPWCRYAPSSTWLTTKAHKERFTWRWNDGTWCGHYMRNRRQPSPSTHAHKRFALLTTISSTPISHERRDGRLCQVSAEAVQVSPLGVWQRSAAGLLDRHKSEKTVSWWNRAKKNCHLIWIFYRFRYHQDQNGNYKWWPFDSHVFILSYSNAWLLGQRWSSISAYPSHDHGRYGAKKVS